MPRVKKQKDPWGVQARPRDLQAQNQQEIFHGQAADFLSAIANPALASVMGVFSSVHTSPPLSEYATHGRCHRVAKAPGRALDMLLFGVDGYLTTELLSVNKMF